MKINTTQQLVETCAERWKSQYFKDNKWDNVLLSMNGPHSSEIFYDKLLACTTKQQIVELMGNDSWVSLRCPNCGAIVEEIVYFEGHDEDSYYLCFECIQNAMNLKNQLLIN